MGKKILLWGIIAAICLSSSFPYAEAAKYVTINDIREEVKDGWHQTYEAHGRTIVVDVDITIPDVDAVPILRVGFPPELILTNQMDTGFVSKIGIDSIVESNPGVFQGDGDSFEMTGSNARAENNPLSFQEAQHIMDELLNSFESQTGPLDFSLRSEVAKSRYYIRERRNGGLSDLNLDKPTTEMGVYEIRYNQVFHGIPFVQTAPYDRAYPPQPDVDKPEGFVFGQIASENNYRLTFFPAIEIMTMSDDSKLVQFTDVKKEFEKAILNGHIREVYDIQLAYYAYYDKENPGETFILQPIWLLRGAIAEKAAFPTPEHNEFSPEFSRRYQGQYAIVEACSGERLGDRRGWDNADTKV